MEKARFHIAAMALAALAGAANPAYSAGPVTIVPQNGRFQGETTMGPDPFHPAMEKFVLRSVSGRLIWADESFGQNACWISNDGRSVVGLRSAGVEGLAGELTFYGDAGQVLRRVPVSNFSGGEFTKDCSLFICLSGDLGISAFDPSGTEKWSVGSGSQYSFNGDGSRLAVVRNGWLSLYHDGREKDALPLDAPYLEDMRYDPSGGSLSFTSPFFSYTYDLNQGRLSLRERISDTKAPRIKTPVRRSPANWPIDSIDTTHPLGNGWGEYQWYGGSPYFHPGIDVMALTDAGVPVYAVAHGWVKAWLTTSGTWHWRLAVADSGLGFSDSCDGWLYAHIDPAQPHLSVGDEVFPGDWIGHLVPWPVTGFDHLHFARIRNAGAVWGNAGADWVFRDDPLNHLAPNTDTEPPVIEQALAGSRFAYCRDNTSQYLPADSLAGDVDIVARIYDRFGLPIPYYPDWEKLNPARIEYAIHGAGGAVPRTSSFLFSHHLPWNDAVLVGAVFKQDDSCVTYGDYDDRQYYYIVTNTDGDTTLEALDTAGCWRTADFPNGQYWVVVYATDQFGNATADSQQVAVNNPAGVQGLPPAAHGTSAPRLEVSPNPFVRKAMISVTVEMTCLVQVSVYNRLGERTKALAGGWLPAGTHRLAWDGTDARGNTVPAGLYFIRAEAAGGSRISRLVRLR